MGIGVSRETHISLENRDCCAQADPRQPAGNGSPAHGPRDTGTGTEVPHRGRRPDGPLPGSRIEPCGNRACDGGLTHHCLRDAPLWTVYAATDVRRSEALGMRWTLVHWEEGAIALGWVVVEEGNTCRLRKLTKEGDDNALIYVDQSVMNVLKWQKERHDAERARLGAAWVDHDLVFARDGFKLYPGRGRRPAGPREGLRPLADPADATEAPRGVPDSQLEAQQGHERSGGRREPRRGLRQRPAPLAGLHHGPVRPLS